MLLFVNKKRGIGPVQFPITYHIGLPPMYKKSLLSHGC
ncbi:hypothetical protein B4119_0667 [Parageobacillus caldoxylosilyticus]|uniref:Uncharacterized protein n=1 Tax=Saccharococcus caldoxylosilyticus TaxID=81408 RepID=A0A150L5A9_9BACL|nr:hypothetical protein B4119_0667 [Parageobacillus caldoxylosilyticus]